MDGWMKKMESGRTKGNSGSIIKHLCGLGEGKNLRVSGLHSPDVRASLIARI